MLRWLGMDVYLNQGKTAPVAFREASWDRTLKVTFYGLGAPSRHAAKPHLETFLSQRMYPLTL
jgi:hypothetical protein